ncbi:MAG TPA: peptidylprolyl isomerase [Gemmatimonadaceae bacterium]
MIRTRRLAAIAAAVLSLSACQGLKEAFTAHVDVAARAGSQELSVTRLSELLGNTTLQIPVNKETATIIADLWTNYQLLAMAAAHGDSLNDPKTIEKAAEGYIANMKIQKLRDSLAKGWVADSGSEEAYNKAANDLYAARHILLGVNPTMTQAQQDSVKRLADQVRAQTTDANFAQQVAKYSTEPGAGQRGGMLPVFNKREMVSEFSNAVAALKPGEISPPVRSQFGWHIVQRMPYAAVKSEFAQRYGQGAVMVAESTYNAQLTEKAHLQVRDGAAKLVRDAAREPAAHQDDDAPVAKFNGGELTVGRVLMWINSVPQAGQLTQQIVAAPDSDVVRFIQIVGSRELLLREAEQAKIDLAAEQKAQLATDWNAMLLQLWSGLGIDPRQLADSAKSESDREKLAATRVEAMLDKIMKGEAQPVPVPPPLAGALRAKYEGKVNAQGIDRAVEAAQKLRQVSDSTRAATQPKSSVPVPMGPMGSGQNPHADRPPVPPTGAGQPQPQPAPAHP